MLDELTTAPAYFRDEIDGVTIPATERVELSAALPWPALSFAVWLARARQPGSGGALRDALRDASGIDRLHALLQDRFFSLAGLIQAGGVLRKAWDPCERAADAARRARCSPGATRAGADQPRAAGASRAD